ncbi:hypothetical protein [Embleya hyalina]|uniref:Uncharacterized protein n=1 Tax=Embleya hyalina TaxID=516124 RepID=A0A401YDC4_9ACTN|nr:hypothetical protein [Embleya hyalina]GCD92597.1 hypothetical protein EHYA_00236 [Embleya hyalina]
MGPATPRPREAADRTFDTARLRRLRGLNRALRVLWVAALAPLLLFNVPLVVIAATDGTADPWEWAAIGIGGVLLPFAYVAIQVMQGWAAQSYRHRHDGVKRREVDWGDPRWEAVRASFEASGLDPRTIRALSVWDRTATLVTRHVPRPTPGRLGRGSDWGVRNGGCLLGLGLVCGIVVAVLDELDVDPTDGTAFTVFLVVASAVVWPLAWRNGRAQASLNLGNPDNVVLIPMHWRPQLRDNPSFRVHLMHEIAHARHDDPGRRKLLDTCAGVGPFAVFVDSAAVVAMRLGDVVLMVLFAATLVSGIAGVRRAKRLIPLVQELRADTEACRDPEAVGHLSAFLRERQAEQPSHAKATRLAALTEATWRGPGARLVAPAALPAALFGLLILASAIAQWAGVVGSSG